MWREYSIGFIRKNRASSLSVMVAAFIASLCLSFLCCMAYNFWVYNMEKIVLDEGDWQGRITGDISAEDMLILQNFANVERAVKNEELSGDQETVIDLYFKNPRTIFEDMPLITERLGLEPEAQSFHLSLLSNYLIHDPQDATPSLLLTFYIVIVLLVSLSLVLIIHNSFAVSMNARVHQFGIFSSVGATPGQIRTCLIQEAAILCSVPVLIGNVLGILLSYGAREGIEVIVADMPGRYDIGFHYRPAVFVITILLSALTVLFSAWLPARKLSKLTPLQAIRGTDVIGLKRKRNSRILALLFGVEGELAGNALKAQKKALRTSTLSLTLSFLGFTMMLCLFSLTDLSTKYTYTQRYQDKWDVMVTVKDVKAESFDLTEELRELNGVRDLIFYQKAEACLTLSEDAMSRELAELGGVKAVAGDAVRDLESGWEIRAPIVVLDDAAFLEYCQQAGVPSRPDGVIILNRIWDSINSVFRYREYVPFIKEDLTEISLHNAGGEGGMEVPVLGYTQEVPVLKEEYEDYALVQFVPLSLWKREGGAIQAVEKDACIRILAGEGGTLSELDQLEQEITKQLMPFYAVESQNRMEDHMMNERIIGGYKLVIGFFCTLLAIIGIANVFSYTSGFLRQRRREFAQYMSVGISPAGMGKMFFVEALVIAGRPILITLPITVWFVEFTARASYLNPQEVWPEIPAGTIGLFCLLIVGCVGLAYYIGGKRVLKYSLAEALRDDTMA